MSEDGSDATLDQGSDVPRGGAVPEHVEETSHRAVGSSRDGCQGHDRRRTVILSTSNSQVKFTKAHRTVQKNNITIGEISGVHWGLKERWF